MLAPVHWGQLPCSCPATHDTYAFVSFNFVLNKNEFSTNKRFKKAFENIFKRWTNFRTGFPRVGQCKWMTCFQFETAYVRFRLLYTVHVKYTKELKNCPSRSKSKNGFSQAALWLKFILREFSKIISIEAERRKHSTDLSCCRLDGVRKCSSHGMEFTTFGSWIERFVGRVNFFLCKGWPTSNVVNWWKKAGC